MTNFDVNLAYFSPETLLPATSIIATIFGILLMLGRGSIRYFARFFKAARRTTGRIASTSKPHLRFRDKSYSRSPGNSSSA